MFKILITLALFATTPAWAQMKVEYAQSNIAAVENLQPQQMAANTMYSGYRVLPFSQWTANQVEVLFLNRYPENREVVINGVTDKLTVFVAKNKFLLNKPAAALNLQKLMTLENIKKIDTSLSRHQQITVAQAQPQVDPNMAFLNPPGRKWCDGSVLCWQARYEFGTMWSFFVSGYNAVAQPKKPYESFIDFQTETRLMNTQELQSQQILALTNIPNKPVAGIVQSVFFVSHYLEFAKMVVVIQENPAQPQTSVVTLVFAAAVEDDATAKAIKYVGAEKVNGALVGTSPVNFQQTGPARGLPQYSHALTQAIANLLVQ